MKNLNNFLTLIILFIASMQSHVQEETQHIKSEYKSTCKPVTGFEAVI